MALPMIRHLFFDIDGTVLGASGKVTPAVRAAFERLGAHGVTAGIASGRAPFFAGEVLSNLPVTGPSVFLAGALVFDTSKSLIIDEAPLDTGDIRRIHAAAQKYDLVCEFFSREHFFAEREHSLTRIHAEEYIHAEPVLVPFDDLTEKIYKAELLAYESGAERLDLALAELREYSIGKAKGAAHPEVIFCNVASPRATKARAFDSALGALGLTADQVAMIGDSENDLPFIELSGVGIAMGNSPERVRSAADFVAPGVEEDGAARAIEWLLAGE